MDHSAVYGLIGYPLGHSFSAKYFAEKFDREGIAARYVNFELPHIERIEDVLRSNPGLRGFNVTIPYKRSVIPHLDSLDATAVEAGAVNVVRIMADGSLRGYNTDIIGFVDALRSLLDNTPEKRTALVLGSGGAAGAVCAGLKRLGITPTIVSRHKDKGDITYDELTAETVRRHNIIVNATPVGMYPDTEKAPAIPYEGITDAHLCFDLVYNPLRTRFMEQCSAMGAKVSNGLDMLYAQADEAWRIWTSAATL